MMPTWAFVVLAALAGIAGLVAVVASIIWLLEDVQRVIAPDTADEEAIKRKFGDNPTTRRRAMARRFNRRNSHWKDALTGLSGLLGLAILYWLWFG